VRVSDLAAAIKYKASVIGKTNPGRSPSPIANFLLLEYFADAAPPWFDAALQPTNQRLDTLGTRLTAIEGRLATIAAQQTDTYKIAVLVSCA
jgi:hypothetical protein